MSTNSGREGSCEHCDHAMNEHTRKSESKCKNKACRMEWHICQSFHGEGGSSISRRICYKPCSCKEQYHPDKAKSAIPLAPHEYKIGHPGYRALPQEEEEEDEEEEILSPSPQAKDKPSASSSKHGTTSSDAKHKTSSKKTPSKTASSNKTSKKPSSKPKSRVILVLSSSKQPISPSSESSEDPLSCSKRTIDDIPRIAGGLAQMKIASTTTKYTYEPVSTTAYTQAVSYTSANALPYSSNAPAPNPTDTLTTTSTSTPAQAARKVDVRAYEVDNETCWAFELDGKMITSYADEWVHDVTQIKVPIMRYIEHNVYFYKTTKK